MIEYTVTVDDEGTRSWRLNGKLHREDGPAIEETDGEKEWYINGERHRADGPAIEYADGTREWWVNGTIHREDGPAIEYADGTREWWFNGVYLSEAEFNAIDKPKELTVNEIEELLGYKIKVVRNA